MAKSKKIAEYGDRPYKVGDEVTIKNEVAGMTPGSEGEVTEVKSDGSLFRVLITKGLKAGQEFLIKADDLR